MGPTDVGFPSFQVVLKGSRFIAGASILDLIQAFKQKNEKLPSDFVDLCAFLTESDLESLVGQCAWGVLNEGDMVVLPAGWLIATGCWVAFGIESGSCVLSRKPADRQGLSF